MDLVEFTVEPEDSVHLTLTWQPMEVMRCRELVTFKVDDTYRLQTVLLGCAEKRPKPQKVCQNVFLSFTQIQTVPWVKPFYFKGEFSFMKVRKSLGEVGVVIKMKSKTSILYTRTQSNG